MIEPVLCIELGGIFSQIIFTEIMSNLVCIKAVHLSSPTINTRHLNDGSRANYPVLKHGGVRSHSVTAAIKFISMA